MSWHALSDILTFIWLFSLMLLVVSTNFPNSPAVTAVVAYSLFAVVASLVTAVVMGRSGRRVCKAVPLTNS